MIFVTNGVPYYALGSGYARLGEHVQNKNSRETIDSDHAYVDNIILTCVSIYYLWIMRYIKIGIEWLFVANCEVNVAEDVAG